MKAGALSVERAVWRRMAARQDFTPQGADLAGQAVFDAKLFRTQPGDTAFAQLRLRQLHQQTRNHPRRRSKALIEGLHQLIANIEEHPGRGQRPEQHEGRAEGKGQAQAQAHGSGASVDADAWPAGPRR